MGPYHPRVRRNLGVAPMGNFRARWLHELQPISNLTLWGWGFHTVRGVINPGNLRFRPRFVEVVEIWEDF